MSKIEIEYTISAEIATRIDLALAQKDDDYKRMLSANQSKYINLKGLLEQSIACLDWDGVKDALDRVNNLIYS